MSVLSNESFYWAKETAEDINGIPARYTVDFEGNAICTHSFSLEHVFDDATSVDSYGLYMAFYNCTGITGSISFPELTSIDNYGLYDAFYNCTGITELHFRSDMQSTIGSNKYGATNATVYFDL